MFSPIHPLCFWLSSQLTTLELVRALTDDQALHLIFLDDLDLQCLANLVVELERAASGGHDAELAIAVTGAIELLVLEPQLSHELDASIDLVRLELDEVEATSELAVGAGFGGEVDEFGEGASDLFGVKLER